MPRIFWNSFASCIQEYQHPAPKSRGHPPSPLLKTALALDSLLRKQAMRTYRVYEWRLDAVYGDKHPGQRHAWMSVS
jgi:hypothetical protein